MALSKKLKASAGNKARGATTIHSPNLGKTTVYVKKPTKSKNSVLTSKAKYLTRTSAIGKAIRDSSNTARLISSGSGRMKGASSSIPRAINTASAANKASKPKSVNDLLSQNISGTMYEDVANKNNALSVQMNRENNMFNAQQAAEQRAYEERLANTAHQREVQDLMAAGLNPVLSAGGQGAATPVGSNASASQFTGVDTSIVNALADLAATSISSNATMTAAATNAAATQTAAAMNSNAMMYGSDMNYQAARYSSDQALAASRYSANQSLAGTKYQTKGQVVSNLIGSALGLGKMFIK